MREHLRIRKRKKIKREMLPQVLYRGYCTTCSSFTTEVCFAWDITVLCLDVSESTIPVYLYKEYRTHVR